MNPINNFFLKAVLLPLPLYKRIGVNPEHLRIILRMKLLMDDRRPNTIQQTKKQKEKAVSLATLFTMFLSLVFGCLFLLPFSIGENDVVHLTFFFTMFIFMLSVSLISDFTSVLIDVRDNFIILPKPVSDKTVVTARMLHILVHLCKLVIPMALPATIYVSAEISAGAGIALFLICLLATLFSVFFINAIYIFILRVTTPKRFQSIIGSFQILFAIFLYASYQLFPRMLRQIENIDERFFNNKWIAFTPPNWFAQTWLLLTDSHNDKLNIYTAVLGLIIPFIGMWLVIKFLAPSFNRKLSMINSSDTSPSETRAKTKTNQSLSTRLSNWFTVNQQESFGFRFTWKMTSRSKDFKMKVYPSMGYIVVYIVVMAMNSKKISLESLEENAQVGRVFFVSVIYSIGLILINALQQVNYSEKYKAAWIFFAGPLKNPGDIVVGTLKSLLVKFYLPAAVLIGIGGIAVNGLLFVPNWILGVSNEILMAGIITYFSHRKFPFSLHQNQNVKTGSFMRTIVVIVIIGILGSLQYFLYFNTIAISILAALSLIANWLVLGSLRKTGWGEMLLHYR